MLLTNGYVWLTAYTPNIGIKAMANEPRRAAKTEVLSMRIDPKTRFILEILSRHRGQSISTVVERAIMEVGEQEQIGGKNTWRDYWDLNEGIRAIKIAEERNLYPTYEEELQLSFVRAHRVFFYYDSHPQYHNTGNFDVLWPRIDEFVDIWEATRFKDYFAAGKAMRSALVAAGRVAPEWPRKTEAKPAAQISWEPPGSSDLDDEIPF